MLRAIFAALLLAAAASPARAVFTSDEMSRIDAEPLLDSEYFLDVQSFDYPVEWRWDWRKAGRGYRINGASLDRSDLLLAQEVKLPARLLDWLDFRYHLVHNGDKDVEELHQWVHIGFGPFGPLSFDLFGEPTFDKEDADIGLRMGWRPVKSVELFGSANAVDWNFNKRGKTTQRYADKPYTFVLGAGAELDASRLSASVELDMPLRRQVPDDNRLYYYRRTRLRLDWESPRGDQGWAWLGGYAYEFKREGDIFLPDPTSSTQHHHRKVHTLHAAAETRAGERDRFEVGGRLMIRGGRSDFPNFTPNSSRYKRWELMPHARWRRELRPWAVSEAAVFLSSGEQRRIFAADGAPAALDTVVEAKLGLGIDFVYGSRGRLGFYGTFDIDNFAQHAWDGGNIRAMFLF